MAKALPGLDEHFLAGAAAAVGTAKKKDAVTRALRKVGGDARPVRRRAGTPDHPHRGSSGHR